MARFSMPANYQEPKNNSSYLNPSKLEEGTIKIRILSQPIVGWEEWHEKKPVRHRFDEKPDHTLDDDGDLNLFTSMIVWNYNTKNVEILSFTQASIRKPLLKYAADPDWGSAFDYDIKITKEGSGKDTEYSISALPHSELLPQIRQAFMEKPIWLDALFDGKDPFELGSNRTPLGIDEPDDAKQPDVFANSDNDVREEIDFETFMDFLPDNTAQDQIEEFVRLASNAAKISPEKYMARFWNNDDIDGFMGYFVRWIDKKKKA
jgi:hypothetical protein